MERFASLAPMSGIVMQGCTWDLFGTDGPVCCDGRVLGGVAPQEVVQKVHGHRTFSVRLRGASSWHLEGTVPAVTAWSQQGEEPLYPLELRILANL